MNEGYFQSFEIFKGGIDKKSIGATIAMVKKLVKTSDISAIFLLYLENIL